jgi:energy-converting hydrogenase Eha subunit H
VYCAVSFVGCLGDSATRYEGAEFNLLLLLVLLLFQDVFRMSKTGEDQKKRTQEQETKRKQVKAKEPMLSGLQL